MTLAGHFLGVLGVTVRLTSDEELSRLEERTAQEAVRPLMLRARPYKRAVGHPVGLYRIRSGTTRVRKATLGACLAPVRPVCYTTPLNQIWTPRWSPARTLTSDPKKIPAVSSRSPFWR